MILKRTLYGFISTLMEPPVNRNDLRALTLVGPPRDNPESDPLAVLHLDNRLCMKTPWDWSLPVLLTLENRRKWNYKCEFHEFDNIDTCVSNYFLLLHFVTFAVDGDPVKPSGLRRITLDQEVGGSNPCRSSFFAEGMPTLSCWFPWKNR